MSIVAMPEVAAGARLWRTAGSYRLTIVVKATFAPTHQQPMRVVAPAPIVVDDSHVENEESRSVLAASDLAPYLPRGEVLFVGRARSETGPVSALSVRLGVYGAKPLVEKTLHVVGERTLGESGAGTPAPFVDLPITYEHALRGGMDENPAGIVPSAGAAMPTVLDPDDAASPGGFGPLSARWAGRRRLLRQLDPSLLETAVPELPDAFAWSYFHAAPADQRCTFFAGDEWVVLDNLWRGQARLESRLPGSRGVARIYDGAQHVEVPLVADTLFIDGNREICSLVWRGNVSVDPARLGSMEVLAGLEQPGRPVPWPGDPARSAAPQVSSGAGSAPPGPVPIVEAAYAAAPASPAANPSGSYDAVATNQSGSYNAVATNQSGSYNAVATNQSGSYSAVATNQSGSHDAVATNPSGSYNAVAGVPDPVRTQTPSYGMRYPTPPPGSPHAGRSPTPAPFAAPPPVVHGGSEDDEGHTVMRQVDARLLEQLTSMDVPHAPPPPPPLDPGATEERNESTALFSLGADTTLMQIARGEAASPVSVAFAAARTDAAAHSRAATSQVETARRPTAEHELVDEQTFVHDEADIARLVEASTAISQRSGASPATPPHLAPPPQDTLPQPWTAQEWAAAPEGDPWEERASSPPPTMATPLSPAPMDPARRALRATSRGLGPVHVVEAAAIGQPPAPPAGDPAHEDPLASLEATSPGKESFTQALRGELMRMLVAGHSLAGAQLEGADLADLDLSGQDLSGALLRGARLERSKLDGANLSGAKLEGARMAGVSLTGAKLVGATLDGAVLDGATLLSAALDDASLTGASLVGVILVDATATRASFREAELRDARLDRSRLAGADFERARLTNATFLSSDLSDASFFEAAGMSASFVEATLTGARFDLSHFALARFARASAADTLWNEAVLDGASFEATSLAGATFAKASCQGTIFSSADLSEARFQRAKLDGAVFTGADVQGAIFDSPDGPPSSPGSGIFGPQG